MNMEQQIENLEDEINLVAEVLQKSREDLAENNDKLKDIVERVELLQTEMNQLRQDWEDQNQYIEQRLANQYEGKINTETRLEQAVNQLADNQREITTILQIILKNQNKIIENNQNPELNEIRKQNREFIEEIEGETQ